MRKEYNQLIFTETKTYIGLHLKLTLIKCLAKFAADNILTFLLFFIENKF